jgi:hypothetical protein
MTISIAESRRVTRLAAPVLAALAVAVAALPSGAQAASDTVGASASFTKGALSVVAPVSSVSFGSTQLDGRASYDLAGDIGDWKVTDATGDQRGWNVTVQATDPTAADNGIAAVNAVMRIKVPTATGQGTAPDVAAGDVNGLVRLNTPGGSRVVNATASQGIGEWQLHQDGIGDLELAMPFDTRAVQYDSTIMFTSAQNL